MLQYKYLRGLAILLIILFPTLANLVTHSNSSILVLLALMGLPIALSSKRRPFLTSDEKWVTWAFSAYFAVYLLSFTINYLLGCLPDPRFKFIEHEARLLLIFPIFMLIRYLKIGQGVLWTSVISGSLMAGGYAIVSWIWLDPGIRVRGSYHAISFGDLSLVLSFMSICSLNYFQKKHDLFLLVPLSAFCFGMIACFLSGTRGAWIAIPFLTCILLFYSARLMEKKAWWLLIGACCLMAAGIYMIPAANIGSRVKSVFSEAAEYNQKEKHYSPTAARIEGWRAALIIFSKNPLIGAGPGSFSPLVHQMIAKGEVHEYISIHSQPHSAYMAVMADCGILGLLALIGIFAAPMWSAIKLVQYGKDTRERGYCLMMIVVAFMHFGLTETIFGRNINISFYLIMVATILATGANRVPSRQDIG